MRTLLAVAVVLGCSTSPPPPHWHVSDGFLRDPDGVAVIMRGVNISGDQKMSPYLDDKQPADYQRVRDDWGFNAVRFVITWAAIEPTQGQYDDAYLDGVAERIGWAHDANLVVVLDMHEDIYGEGFGYDGAPTWACAASFYAAFVPQMPWYQNALDPNVEACVDQLYTLADTRSRFIAAWQHVAHRLADVPGVIGFDALNEPNWGTYSIRTFEHDRLEPFYTSVVAAVRSEAPLWVAFLEPGASRNLGLATSLVKFGFPDVMYAPHAYDSGAESGSGFDPSHRQAILDNGVALSEEAQALDAGLWIGEYGGVATDPGIGDYMTAEYDAAGAVAGSAMYWAYDAGGYGFVGSDGSERPELISVLVRPYPERVAGKPSSYAFDATTSTFTFAYAPDHSKQPTQIVVPPRTYPSGYTVACGDCQFHMEAGELVIDKPASGAAATVVLTPAPASAQ